MDFANYSKRIVHLQEIEKEWQRCRADLNCLLDKRLIQIKEQQNHPKEPPSKSCFNVHSLKDIDWAKYWWPCQIIRGSDTDDDRKEEDKIIEDAWNAFLKSKLE